LRTSYTCDCFILAFLTDISSATIFIQDVCRVYFYLFLMNVLLEPSLIVVTSLKEVVIPGDPLMLFLLLLDVVFGLLHADEDLFQFLALLFLLCLLFLALDVITDHVFGGRYLLDLEIDHCSSHLNCLSDGWRERQTLSDEYQSTELRHVILEIKTIVFEPNDGMTTADTYIVDS
jgi:hypothetical protein